MRFIFHPLFLLFITMTPAAFNVWGQDQKECPGETTERDCSQVGVGPGKYCVTVKFSGGRLGNQLFEVATALSLARDNNCLAVFPMFTEEKTWEKMDTWGFDPAKLFKNYLSEEENAIFSKQRLGDHRDATSLSCFKTTSTESARSSREKFREKTAKKLPAKIEGMPMRKMIFNSWSRKKGWGMFKFMSYKLFDHNREYLQKILGPTEKQKEAILSKMEGFGLQMKGKNTCTIHIRRGDRDNLQWRLLFPSMGIKYYKRAIAKMEAMTEAKKEPIDTYIVVSDDIKYAEDIFQKEFPDFYSKGKFFFVDWKKHKQKDYEDLWLMSMANHNIIGNSSFSWWGAYLNPNKEKLVVHPEKFLGPLPKAMGLIYKDNEMSPPEWHGVK